MSFLNIESRCIRWDKDDRSDSGAASEPSKPREPVTIETPQPFVNALVNVPARVARELAAEIEQAVGDGSRPLRTGRDRRS